MEYLTGRGESCNKPGRVLSPWEVCSLLLDFISCVRVKRGSSAGVVGHQDTAWSATYRRYSRCTLFKKRHSQLSDGWHAPTICFQNHSLPLIGCHSLLLILFSRQPRPVHWTCSVATWIVRLSGTNFPSHFVPIFKSVGAMLCHTQAEAVCKAGVQ